MNNKNGLNAKYITPAVTIFTQDGQPDARGGGALYEHLINGGVDGILALGSTGEFFAMPLDMRRTVAREAIRATGGRVKLLIGAGSMMFGEIAPFANDCLDRGADAVIVIPPYYFPLDDEAVYAYYDRLARDIRGSLYLYNFPARTGYSLSVETVERLALEHANIIGIKDTIPGMDHTRALIERVKPLRPDFEIYSGFDENLTANAFAGGDGCIAGLSNIYPEICAYAARALRQGDIERAVFGQRLIQRLFALYYINPGFIPIIKEAVRLRGVVESARCMFPMAQASQGEREKLKALMEDVEREAGEALRA